MSVHGICLLAVLRFPIRNLAIVLALLIGLELGGPFDACRQIHGADNPAQKPLQAPAGPRSSIGEEPPAASKDPAGDAASSAAGNAEVERIMREFQGRGDLGDNSRPTPPAETLQKFQLLPDLQLDLVAAEPDVMQPLYLWFDERGRMWLVEYRQYPFPAGLKIVRYDQYLRAVFDNVPKPPPHHVPGADRVSVFEDTDGDGQYDSHKTVLDGLNIATSVVTGYGGIWVMNPPYLLFYPDADGDDIPDGNPEVKLSGFGLQDTHAVANSLSWGPDGWLYGANGSTTTGDVQAAHGRIVRFEGQCIWRFHPRTNVFELFAEGGGNTFSLEFDDAGRAFSGTNASRTRGMFYPQGSYGEKNFGKHGPLSNPYAFGYFPHMQHAGDGDRFAQTFVLYSGTALPARYQGQIIAANALHNRIWASRLIPQGSTYRTEDEPVMCTSEDRWFRPVDLKLGPDGAIYLADWYDTRLTHVDPRDTWHKQSGRIYRLRGANMTPQPAARLDQMSDAALLALLVHPNKWQRQTAVRVLGERLLGTSRQAASTTTLSDLQARCTADQPEALEALWALQWGNKLQESLNRQLIVHPQPDVRRWAIRLLGDRRSISEETGRQLARQARLEPDVQVRSQLASTARRLETVHALPILEALLTHAADVEDPHLPLMVWWALETHLNSRPRTDDPHLGVSLKTAADDSPRQQVLQWLQQPEHWQSPLFAQAIAPRLLRRLAQETVALAADQQHWEECEQVLALAPSTELRQVLLAGFLEAFQGQDLSRLPEGLKQALVEQQSRFGKSDLLLGLRLKDPVATKAAFQAMRSEKTHPVSRLLLLSACGELDLPDSVPTLMQVLNSPSSAVKKQALQSLSRYQDPRIPVAICKAYQSSLSSEDDQRGTALRVLVSRPEWAAALLSEIEEHRIAVSDVPVDLQQQLRLHRQPELQQRINRIWGQVRASGPEKKQFMDQVHRLLAQQNSPDATNASSATLGQALFRQHCGTCHTLFGEGGSLGPNLTGYERSNLDFLLLAIIDPSAGIREEFTQFQVVTTDGRILTGLLTDQTPVTITLRVSQEQTVTLRREDVEVLQAMATSLMPEGLLQKLDEKQILDLFAFLMAPVPPQSAQTESK